MSSEPFLSTQPISGRVDDDGVYIFDSQHVGDDAVSCTGCLSYQQSENTVNRHVPYEDIVWCEQVAGQPEQVQLSYVLPAKATAAVVTEVVQLTQYQPGKDAASGVLERAYVDSRVRPTLLVVLNNHGGRGNALKIYRAQILPVLAAAQAEVTYIETNYSKHAVDIGREMDVDKYDAVVCCLGDGVPHEIINGMYERADRAEAFSKIAVTQLPCGLGNAMSLSTHGTNNPGVAALRMLKLRRCKMDLMCVTQPSGVRVSFLSQAYGAIADSDIGTEHLRWMGPLRFDLGVAQRMIAKTLYPCDVYVQYGSKDNHAIRKHLRQHAEAPAAYKAEVTEQDLAPQHKDVSAPVPADWVQLDAHSTADLNIFYVGNMPWVLSDAQFFPAAYHDDGHMDLVVLTTRTPFFKMAKILFSVDSGEHVHLDELHHAKITAYRLLPRVEATDHYISVDGESFPFEPLQVEVLPRVLTVLLQKGTFRETHFAA